MNPDAATLALSKRSIASFMADAFAVSDDQALSRAVAELDAGVQAKLQAFWRGFERDFSIWSAAAFDAADEWWEEKIGRFEDGENEFVDLVRSFDAEFDRTTAHWDLSPAEREAELERARRTFVPVVSKLPLACREARERLIGLYGSKRAGHGAQVCQSADDVDRTFAAMGY